MICVRISLTCSIYISYSNHQYIDIIRPVPSLPTQLILSNCQLGKMRRNGNFNLETDLQALDTDLILDLKKTSLKNQMKTKQISFLEYYRGYMRWETYRWSKNVINHVGPQVDQVQ